MTWEQETASPDRGPLRPPSQVMRLNRMGSFHQTRLSFMRILLRRLRAEAWRFGRPLFDIDARGTGRALYTATGPDRTYTLVAFGHDLPAEKRSDRVIAEAWDATFTLFDGVPTEADIDRLARNVPLQEAGRITETELVLARANRSVRLFEHVVDRLAQGAQPDLQAIEAVGYLMRTTAVYGSGKFGAADREIYSNRPEHDAPFQAEMLTVWLIRAFVLDLVEHLARLRAPETAVPLDPALRRRFGIGNSTGLGMAPFLITHPMLIHNWIATREEALARVRGLPRARPAQIAIFEDRFNRANVAVDQWRSDHPVQNRKLAMLREDMDLIAGYIAEHRLATDPHPWDRMHRWADSALSVEGQEMLVALMLEPHGDLVDGLSVCLSADETQGTRIDGAMRLSALQALIEEHYDWTGGIDWTARDAQARAWYTSAEKLEPRLGERFEEPIADYEQPLAPARDAAMLHAALAREDPHDTVAAFLMRAPQHRHIVRRIQLVDRCPYAEIRDNTIAHDMLPIDMLRCKLSFFGAGQFDPRSDRWVRINMFQGAPFPHDLHTETEDDWIFPPLR